MRVAIIGGGICGLYLAGKLSEKGHEITVFERKKEIGQDICSGLFSERILDFIPQSEKLIQNRINYVIVNFPRKKVRVDFSKDFFVMSHFELDKLTANLAETKGAKLLLNHNIDEMPRGFDRIIGCDGANSFARRNLGLQEPKYRLGILGFIDKSCSKNYVETWPCKNGFIWKIPRGNKIEYGLIAEPKEIKELGSFFKGTEFLKIKSRVVPQGFIIPSNPSTTLCGDAVGLTKPWSGGGVVWSLIAAEILVKTFPDFLKYKKEMKRFFIPKIILSKTAVKLVYFLGFETPWLLPSKILMESDFLL